VRILYENPRNNKSAIKLRINPIDPQAIAIARESIPNGENFRVFESNGK
jgi:hypothetical protein